MAGNLTDYAENKLADFIRSQGLTLPANWFVALGSAATDSTFTELSGTGYARVSIARSLANWAGTQGAGTTTASNGTSHETSNNIAISWGNPGSAWGVATFIGLFDASTSGNCWLYLPINPITITTGNPNPVQLAAAAVAFTVGLAGGTTDYLANKLIDLLMRAQSFSWPATIYFAAFTTLTTNASGGTEVVASGYARKSLAADMTNLSGTQGAGTTVASTGTLGRIGNNAALTYVAPTADWGTVMAEAVMDASTAGNMLFHAPLSPTRTIVNGGPALTHAADKVGFKFS